MKCGSPGRTSRSRCDPLLHGEAITENAVPRACVGRIYEAPDPAIETRRDGGLAGSNVDSAGCGNRDDRRRGHCARAPVADGAWLDTTRLASKRDSGGCGIPDRRELGSLVSADPSLGPERARDRRRGPDRLRVHHLRLLLVASWPPPNSVSVALVSPDASQPAAH